MPRGDGKRRYGSFDTSQIWWKAPCQALTIQFAHWHHGFHAIQPTRMNENRVKLQVSDDLKLLYYPPQTLTSPLFTTFLHQAVHVLQAGRQEVHCIQRQGLAGSVRSEFPPCSAQKRFWGEAVVPSHAHAANCVCERLCAREREKSKSEKSKSGNKIKIFRKKYSKTRKVEKPRKVQKCRKAAKSRKVQQKREKSKSRETSKSTAKREKWKSQKGNKVEKSPQQKPKKQQSAHI